MRIMGKDSIRSRSLLQSVLAQNTDALRLDIKQASRGCLVVLEGIDGTGKTTLVQALGEKLSHDLGEMVIVTQEPTERFKGFNELESLIFDWPIGNINPEAVTSLKFTLDHAIHLADVILPALADDRVIICDRWTPFSSRAYQGPVASILTHKWDIDPDISILLTLDPVLALERLGNRPEGQLKCFEKLETLRKAQEIYMELASAEPLRWWYFDALLPQEALLDKTLKVIMSTIINRRG
jgi:dTMP kinase